MRRRVRDLDAIPEHLLVFRLADWSAATTEDAFVLWRTARRQWAERYGWPGGALARLTGESDVRAVLRRSRLLPWSRSGEPLQVVVDRLEHLYGYRPKLLTSRPDHGPTPSPISPRRHPNEQ